MTYFHLCPHNNGQGSHFGLLAASSPPGISRPSSSFAVIVIPTTVGSSHQIVVIQRWGLPSGQCHHVNVNIMNDS